MNRRIGIPLVTTDYFHQFAKITSPLIELINSIAETAERAIMERKPVTTAKVIGASIRRLRMEHGETQQQLGEFLGYGATTIANYESGLRLPNLETFLEIAVRYSAEIRDFIIPPTK